jgi:hypothetical protein
LTAYPENSNYLRKAFSSLFSYENLHLLFSQI